MPSHRDLVDSLVAEFTDKGKIVEAGWVALRHLMLGPQAPEFQVSEMRKAYFFGAQHLFASIMGVLDDGTEPTDDDLRRLDLIDQEIKAFIAEMRRAKGDAREEAPVALDETGQGVRR